MSGLGDAIGSFVIGESAIGDASLFDWTRTLLAQYANSPTLLAFCQAAFNNFDQAANYDAFFDTVWNLDSAAGWGLDVLGRIVGVSRVIQVNTAGKFFGFEEAGNASADPFNQAPFYAGEATTSNFPLSDALFRTLIRAKAYANICGGSIPSLNQLLLTLFPGRGNIYVTSGGNMSMTITSTFAMTLVERAMLTTTGVFPRPQGVSLDLILP